MSLADRLNQQIARLHDAPEALRGPWALTLPAAWAYEAVIRARTRAFDDGRLPITRVDVPVVSVGNLTTGGTGKTPVVMALAQGWQAMGLRVVILTRGYGAREPLICGRPQSAAHGDEAWLLQQALPEIPVIVGRNRAQNAQWALTEYQPDVILLDDGFQYRYLARDVNLVLVDGARLFGNGALLPTGPLREPRHALARADALWLTKSPTPQGEAWLRECLTTAIPGPKPPVIPVPFEPGGLSRLRDPVPLEGTALGDRPVLAVCGIADPASFTRTLTALGCRVERMLCFNDHHGYDARDARTLADALHPGQWLLTTEKDAVKLASVLSAAVADRTAVVRIRPAVNPAAYEVFPPALRPTC